MTRSAVLLFLVALPAALADHKHPFPKIHMSSFRADMVATEDDHNGHPIPDAKSVYAGDQKKLLMLQQSTLPDGRLSSTILDFKGQAQYQEQPFFQ